MNKRNFVIISIVAIVAILAAGVVTAHPGARRGPAGMAAGGHGPGGGGLGPFGRLGMLKEKLDLSDAQVDQIKTIYKDLRAQNESLRGQLRDGRGDAIESLIDNPNDTAAAQAQLDKQLATERALRANMLAATAKALKVLTAEQRAKLGDIMDERQERREARMERRGNRR